MSLGFGPTIDTRDGASLIRPAVERGVTLFDTCGGHRLTGGETGRAGYNAAMGASLPPAAEALVALIDEYRDRCLWFLRRDYYPSTPDEARRVLEYIQRYGDRDGYRRAAAVRQCLFPPSSAVSAAS